jgi:hypothetical protein
MWVGIGCGVIGAMTIGAGVVLGLIYALAYNKFQDTLEGGTIGGPVGIVEELSPPGPWEPYYADVAKSAGERPPQFAGTLPGPDQWDAWLPDEVRFLPYSFARDQLCAGDQVAHGHLARALTKATANDATVIEYGRMMIWCSDQRACTVAGQGVTSKEASPGLKAVYWETLAGCGSKAKDLFAGYPAPPSSYVRWMDRSSYSAWPMKVFYTPKLSAAAQHLIKTSGEARMAAFVLARTQTPDAAADLIAVHGELTDPARKQHVAAALLQLDVPEAQDIGREMCSRIDDAVCDATPLYTGRDSSPLPQSLAKRHLARE